MTANGATYLGRSAAYRAKDDYGLASAEGLVEPQAKGRSLPSQSYQRCSE